MTDPAVTIIYFAVILLIFCLLCAAGEAVMEWRDRRQERREAREMRRRIRWYGRPMA